MLLVYSRLSGTYGALLVKVMCFLEHRLVGFIMPVYWKLGSESSGGIADFWCFLSPRFASSPRWRA